MTHKVTVGLHQKVGQPNFGSLGASCCIELQLDDTEADRPDVVSAKIKRAYAVCRQSVAEQLASDPSQCPAGSPSHRTNTQPAAISPPRSATDAQVRAIRAIASKAGVQVASELYDRYGVRSPSQLTLSQASQVIDHLKATSAPAEA